MTRITNIRTYDLRFPTSESLAGSDAMNPDPDYSCAYLVLETDGAHEGYGLTFTIGRGTELCVAAIETLSNLVIGLDLDWITDDMGRFWRHITGDSQLRWLGPDKGVIHLATGALVNAVWDLWAREADKPVWQLVSEMSPEEIVSLIDFRYITDALSPSEALDILRAAEPGKEARIAKLWSEGYPCYTTSAGWLGYSDGKLRQLCREAKQAGFSHVKFKVGSDLQDDIRRLKIAREELGDDMNLMIDANQVWEVDQAIEWVKMLQFARPLFIEEPTSPDDIMGHKAIRKAVYPTKVATGEVCQNRVMFKQFIMEGALDIVQIDSCRMGGLNEVLTVMLMAAKYHLPVWPHAGGVGLCEYVQHISMIDYVAISGEKNDRRIEYVDHLHEHFEDPCIVVGGAYQTPNKPGFSIQIKTNTLDNFTFSFNK
ncbi:MAG: L-fuconate dehydratase [Amylibacter sp.]|tara:strand:- start:339 stop:1619 length:1281 start_codon:yes stop_codon:yes gene_type:complete